MKAYFSETDDRDEKATRIYTVIGRLDKMLPDIKMRISVGGKFEEINPMDMFEYPFDDFPSEWLDNVTEYNGFKIILIGAGGTGGYIAPHLYRIAFASGCTARIIIADGDIVEEKNLIRQNFAACDIGKNKAQVMAERYAGTFGIETEYIPDFIEDKKTLERLVEIT